MIIDIIGAGIGGLTTAIALEQKGFKVRIFEQATEIRPVGAGIIIANNAMQVYEKLGLRQEIEENGNYISSMNVTHTNLKPISKIDLAYFEQKHQVKNIAIHRSTLQKILVSKLQSISIELNHQLKKITANNNGYLLSFNNQKTHQSSILLGADGINSTVRNALFTDTHIRNAKQVCWRGVTNYTLPAAFQHELNEAWGKHERFGFVQIAKDKVYWFAVKSFKKNSTEHSVNQIENYFKDYHLIINDLINSTPKKFINTAEIGDLKPIMNWHKKNICLIGDAAHATTPNMGQGACQAVEDAYILANCLSKYSTNKAFSQFQKLRIEKAHQVVKTSWMIGKMAHLSNNVLIGMRNQLMKLTPESVNRKQLEKIFKLEQV